MSPVIPTKPTPILSFTPTMPSSLQPAPTHSLVGPSQVRTKPPTVQPASSTTTVAIFVNHQKSPANSHTTSPFVSSRGFSSVLSLPINPATPKHSRLRHSQQAPSQANSSQKKVHQYTSACQVQKAMKYLSPLGTSPTS